jgi:hypothetical protein
MQTIWSAETKHQAGQEYRCDVASLDTLSARDMIEALIAGERDPQVLAGSGTPRAQADQAQAGRGQFRWRER